MSAPFEFLTGTEPTYHFFPYIISLHSFANSYKSISAFQGNVCSISAHFNFGKLKKLSAWFSFDSPGSITTTFLEI